MPKSRTEAVLKNSVVMVLLQVLKLGVMFVQRTALVKLMPTEYLGIEGLFSNVLQLLNLFELGIGNALVFAMYKPMAEGDTRKLTQLMSLYRKVYAAVGLAVMLTGLSLVPFLGAIVRDAPNIPDVPLIFCMYVFNTAVSYLFVYRSSVLVVGQEQFIVYVNSFVFVIVQNIIQVAVLLLTKNYIAYYAVTIACTVAANLSISRIARSRHPYIAEKPEGRLERREVRAIGSNVVAMALSRIGWTVQNGLDSLVISRFVGLVAVGIYSNYMLVSTAVLGLVQKFYTALTPSVGNLGVGASAEHAMAVFRKTMFLTGLLATVTTACQFACFTPMIKVWIGEQFLLPEVAMALICVSSFQSVMRRCAYTFDEAYGLFVHCKLKPVGESIANIAISVILAQRYGVAGVVTGTIVSQLMFSFWIEPLVLHRHVFGVGLGGYFASYLKVSLVTALSSALCWWLGSAIFMNESVLSVVVIGAVSAALSASLYVMVFWGEPGCSDLVTAVRGVAGKVLGRVLNK